MDLSALKERVTAKQQPPTPRPAAAAPDAVGAGAPWPTIVDVTEQTFETEVLIRSSEVLVVVDLWAAWSEPSLQLSPMLEQLAEESAGAWVLARLDVDQAPRIAQAFGVQSVPTVIAIAAGQPVHAFSGVQSEPQLRRWIGELLIATDGKLGGPPGPAGEAPVDPRLLAAEEAADAGDYEAAEAAYQAILDVEPKNPEAKAAIHQVRFIARAQTASSEALQRAADNPSDIDAQLEAADVEVLAQQPERAFARLIEVVRLNAGDERKRARERLLGLFELFDPSDPTVLAARRKLAAALY